MLLKSHLKRSRNKMTSYERRDKINGNSDNYKDAVPVFSPPSKYQDSYQMRYTPRNFIEKNY